MKWGRIKQYIFNRYFKQDILDYIDPLLKIQGTTGNWNYDAYMHGLYNGMVIIRIAVTGSRSIKMVTAPSKWLADRNLMAAIEESQAKATSKVWAEQGVEK